MELGSSTLKEEAATKERSIFILREEYPQIRLTEEARNIIEDFKSKATAFDRYDRYTESLDTRDEFLKLSLKFSVNTYPIEGDYAVSVSNSLIDEIQKKARLSIYGQAWPKSHSKEIIYKFSLVCMKDCNEEMLKSSLESLRWARELMDRAIVIYMADFKAKACNLIQAIHEEG